MALILIISGKGGAWPKMNVYDFHVRQMNGKELDLSVYRGNVLLIVNTASKCGFTPQFEDLEKLFQKYRDHGFMVLGFLCNQFHEQDPESNDKIAEFCRYNYGVTFPMLAKTNVKGPQTEPLFRYLTNARGFSGFDPDHPLTEKLQEILSSEDPHYAENPEIKWNFTKFVIDREGEVAARYEPTASMREIESCIKELL